MAKRQEEKQKVVQEDPGMDIEFFSQGEAGHERACGSRDTLPDRQEQDGDPLPLTMEDEEASLMQASIPPWKRHRRDHEGEERPARRRECGARPGIRRARPRARGRSRVRRMKNRSIHGRAGHREGGHMEPRRRQGAHEAARKWSLWRMARESLHLPLKRRFDCGGTWWGLTAENEKGGSAPMGLPTYMVQNVEAALSKLNMEEVNIMMTSLVQVQSLVMAQVSQAVQERIRELAAQETTAPTDREEETEWPEEDDEERLMQRSLMVATGDNGIGSFGFWLQKMTEELAEMDERGRAICSDILRGHLTARYGTTSASRRCMGERARSLEALVVAFQGPETTESEMCERVEDKKWVAKWWNLLIQAMRQEELIAARAEESRMRARASTDTVEETQDTIHTVSSVQEGDQGVVPSRDEEADPREMERRIRDEIEHERELNLQRQVEEYEQNLKEEEQEDLARLEDYEAVVAAEASQQWDDWAMESEMSLREVEQGPPLKAPRLRVIMQQHEADGGVVQRREMLVPLGLGSTVTLGFQVEGGENVHQQGRSVKLEREGECMGRPQEPVNTKRPCSEERRARGLPPGCEVDGRDTVSPGSSSTERVSHVASPPRRETAEGDGARDLSSAVTQPSDVALFLSSSEGALLYQNWASGLISDARVIRVAGALVLDAFQTQQIFLATARH